MPVLGGQSWHRGVPHYVKDINRFITSLHPTGEVVFPDDFETDPVKWVKVNPAGGTGTFTHDATVVFRGGKGGRINTTVGANDDTEIYKYFNTNLYKLSPIGLEFWFCPHTMADAGVNQLFQFGFEYGLGTEILSFYGYYVSVARKWQIWTGGMAVDVTAAVEDNPLKGSWKNWVYVKLVGDFIKGVYKELTIGGNRFPLTQYPVHRYASAPVYFEYFFWLRNNGNAAVQDVAIDDVLCTVREQ